MPEPGVIHHPLLDASSLASKKDIDLSRQSSDVGDMSSSSTEEVLASKNDVSPVDINIDDITKEMQDFPRFHGRNVDRRRGFVVDENENIITASDDEGSRGDSDVGMMDLDLIDSIIESKRWEPERRNSIQSLRSEQSSGSIKSLSSNCVPFEVSEDVLMSDRPVEQSSFRQAWRKLTESWRPSSNSVSELMANSKSNPLLESRLNTGEARELSCIDSDISFDVQNDLDSDIMIANFRDSLNENGEPRCKGPQPRDARSSQVRHSSHAAQGSQAARNSRSHKSGQGRHSLRGNVSSQHGRNSHIRSHNRSENGRNTHNGKLKRSLSGASGGSPRRSQCSTISENFDDGPSVIVVEAKKKKRCCNVKCVLFVIVFLLVLIVGYYIYEQEAAPLPEDDDDERLIDEHGEYFYYAKRTSNRLNHFIVPRRSQKLDQATGHIIWPEDQMRSQTETQQEGTAATVTTVVSTLSKPASSPTFFGGKANPTSSSTTEGKTNAASSADQGTVLDRLEKHFDRIARSPQQFCRFESPIPRSLSRNTCSSLFRNGKRPQTELDGIPRGQSGAQNGQFRVNRRLSFFHATIGTRGENQPFVILALEYAIRHPEEDVVIMIKSEYRAMVEHYAAVYRNQLLELLKSQHERLKNKHTYGEGAIAAANAAGANAASGTGTSTSSTGAGRAIAGTSYVFDDITDDMIENFILNGLDNFRCLRGRVIGMTASERSYLDIEVLRSIGARKTTAWPFVETAITPATNSILEGFAYLNEYIFPVYNKKDIRLNGFIFMWFLPTIAFFFPCLSEYKQTLRLFMFMIDDTEVLEDFYDRIVDRLEFLKTPYISTELAEAIRNSKRRALLPMLPAPPSESGDVQSTIQSSEPHRGAFDESKKPSFRPYGRRSLSPLEDESIAHSLENSMMFEILWKKHGNGRSIEEYVHDLQKLNTVERGDLFEELMQITDGTLADGTRRLVGDNEEVTKAEERRLGQNPQDAQAASAYSQQFFSSQELRSSYGSEVGTESWTTGRESFSSETSLASSNLVGANLASARANLITTGGLSRKHYIQPGTDKFVTPNRLLFAVSPALTPLAFIDQTYSKKFSNPRAVELFKEYMHAHMIGNVLAPRYQLPSSPDDLNSANLVKFNGKTFETTDEFSQLSHSTQSWMKAKAKADYNNGQVSKIVLITFSSWPLHHGLIAKLRKEIDYYLMNHDSNPQHYYFLAAMPKWDPYIFPSSGPRAHYFHYSKEESFSVLFKYVDLIVHHGGNGVRAEVAEAGKPSVIISFNYDQPFNGKNIQALNTGMFWTLKDYLRPDKFYLNKALQEILNSDSSKYEAECKKLQSRYMLEIKDGGGNRKALDFIALPNEDL